jgi:heme/copper-type cytochrome/quinol oxidase subunit 3
MIRPVLTEILLFVAPFAAYALFLVATRAGVLHPDSWRWRVVVPLTIVAVILMIGGFAMLRQHHAHPAGSNYVPPHVKDGKVIPGQFK